MIRQFTGRSEFVKNVATLVTGTAIAQLIALLLSPVLSRIYSPADFGFFAVFMSVVSAVSLIACGRFELAIMLPAKDNDAADIAVLAFRFCVVTSIITTLISVILLFCQVITHPVYLTAGLIVFVIGLFQIGTNVANRQSRYKQIASARIINSISNAVLSIVFGLAGALSVGLIGANLLSQTAATLSLRVNRLHHRSKSFIQLKPIISKYREFLQFNVLQALSDLYSVNGVYYILPLFFNNTVLGLYGFAIRILQAPMSLIGSSIAAVFYQRASQYKNDLKPFYDLIKSTLIKSALVALPMPVVLIAFGPALFAFVFGEQWRKAGEYAQILSPWIYTDFIRATISQFPIVVNRQKELLVRSLIGNFLLSVLLFMGGAYLISVHDVFIVISITMTLYTIYITVWIYNLGKKLN